MPSYVKYTYTNEKPLKTNKIILIIFDKNAQNNIFLPSKRCDGIIHLSQKIKKSLKERARIN